MPTLRFSREVEIRLDDVDPSWTCWKADHVVDHHLGLIVAERLAEAEVLVEEVPGE
jgi:hypothetical protein